MSKKARDKDWRNDPLENTPPVRGSGNFLKDRGYSDLTETRIKFDLVSVIRAIVETKKLRQIDVVALVGRYAPGAGISQPDISRILRGNVNGYSESRLIVILAALGNNVSIVVEPTKGHGHISVRERAAAQDRSAACISNLGVAFEETATIFDDPLFVFQDATRDEESREAAIGFSSAGRLLTVVHLEVEGEFIRIISAWRATGAEEAICDQ